MISQDTRYVVKRGNMYCRFGSYSTCELTPSFAKATSYAREADARKRLSEPSVHWSKQTKILSSELTLHKIRVALVEETELERN